jgi:hypothetical protein
VVKAPDSGAGAGQTAPSLSDSNFIVTTDQPTFVGSELVVSEEGQAVYDAMVIELHELFIICIYANEDPKLSVSHTVVMDSSGYTGEEYYEILAKMKPFSVFVTDDLGFPAKTGVSFVGRLTDGHRSLHLVTEDDLRAQIAQGDGKDGYLKVDKTDALLMHELVLSKHRVQVKSVVDDDVNEVDAEVENFLRMFENGGVVSKMSLTLYDFLESFGVVTRDVVRGAIPKTQSEEVIRDDTRYAILRLYMLGYVARGTWRSFGTLLESKVRSLIRFAAQG